MECTFADTDLDHVQRRATLLPSHVRDLYSQETGEQMKTWIVLCGMSLFFGSAFAQEKGAELYGTHCKKCHAEDGSGKKEGKPLAVVKSLKLSNPESLNLLTDDAKKLSAEKIAEVISKGTKGMEGKEGKMKGLSDKVTADQAKEIAAHVMKLQGR
jgi:hypothetical protein